MILTENVFRCKHFSVNWQQFSFSYKREVSDQNAPKTFKNDQITPKTAVWISLESQKSVCFLSKEKNICVNIF